MTVQVSTHSVEVQNHISGFEKLIIKALKAFRNRLVASYLDLV